MEQNKITSNKQVILIADSNPDNIDVLTAMLRPFYRVKSATNGAMALKIAASSEPPDLILLDSMMQEMDGYTVCEQLKANPSTRKIPVIFVSTTDETWDETKGLALGADDSITKPVRPSIVKALIKTHLRLHDQHRELEEMVRLRTEEIQESHTQLLHRLGVVAEYGDANIGNHIIRIGKFSHILALAAGLAEEEAELLLMVAPMHDVGKIGIPESVLLKPGKLDAGEWETMKKHPAIGGQIIGVHPSESLRMARLIALTHHEWWDGTGYPNALSGKYIPIAGRIVAIADVFDALTHERPYKKAWTVDEAVVEIRRGSGSHFDPELVQVFLECLPEFREVNKEYSDLSKCVLPANKL